jgi:RNA polymerase sigma-70 factor (ECF subfamily)
MNSPAHDELLRHARALRRLAVALVGSQDADDLVQDAVVATLQRPPANMGSWFPWLSGMLRYMAGKRRRGEQRRRRREQTVADAAAGAAVAPSAIDVAAQRAAVTELHERLLAVPEPYQSTLLLRYFQDLSPQQIAARTATPLATVKSQLQRGLSLLRRRYDGDRDHRGDWRAGLLAAFGIEPPAAAAAASAAGAGIVMGIKGCSSLLAVLLIAAIWMFPLRPAMPETAPTASTTPPSPAVAAPLPDETPVRGAADVTPTAAAAAETPAAPRSVRTRGRCIDEASAPLADVAIQVAISAPPRNERETVQQLRSAADGTFAFEVALPTNGHVSIDFRADGRIGMAGSWQYTLVDDVGDVMLPRGVEVHGRIVDAGGRPQSGVRVCASRLRMETGPLRADIDWSDRTSDQDGRFAFGGRFPLGPFALRCTNRRLLSPTPAQWELSTADDRHLCELVVAPAPPPCRGVVVDEAGQPIVGAHIQMDGHGASTDEHGLFAVEQDLRRRDATSEVAASADGFEHAKVSWNRDDPGQLRLVLTRSPDLQVHVVDGRSGTPVERFAVVRAKARFWHETEKDVPVRSWPGGVASLPAGARRVACDGSAGGRRPGTVPVARDRARRCTGRHRPHRAAAGARAPPRRHRRTAHAGRRRRRAARCARRTAASRHADDPVRALQLQRAADRVRAAGRHHRRRWRAAAARAGRRPGAATVRQRLSTAPRRSRAARCRGRPARAGAAGRFVARAPGAVRGRA